MSVITHLLGRVTRDPVMQQGKNTGTEYISLDLAVTQRSQNTQNGQTPYETVYYQCYFNKFLADRLQKAGVKKGTGLYVYGDLELHPFIYQQGQRAGQPGINAKINVRDWDFPPSNKPANESGSAPGMTPSGNATPTNGGAAQGGSGYQNPGMANNGGYMGAANGASYGPAHADYAGNNSPNNGYAGNANYAAPTGNAPQTYGGAQAPGAGDGFNNVPEYRAGQLPFS